MRTFKTLAIAALLTAGAMAQASAASSFDSFDLGSVGASRQLKLETSRTNGALGASASANMPGKRMTKPAMSYRDRDSAGRNGWPASN